MPKISINSQESVAINMHKILHGHLLLKIPKLISIVKAIITIKDNIPILMLITETMANNSHNQI